VYLINAPPEYAKTMSNIVTTNLQKVVLKAAYVINMEIISDAYHFDF